MLKRGDRVRLASPRYTWLGLSPGAGGVVLRDHDAGDIVGVSFDDWQKGHNVDGLLKDASGWYVGIEDIKPEVIDASQQTGSATQPEERAEGTQGNLRDVQAPARRGGNDKNRAGASL